jgi:hypothetical protein
MNRVCSPFVSAILTSLAASSTGATITVSGSGMSTSTGTGQSLGGLPCGMASGGAPS